VTRPQAWAADGSGPAPVAVTGPDEGRTRHDDICGFAGRDAGYSVLTTTTASSRPQCGFGRATAHLLNYPAERSAPATAALVTMELPFVRGA
jgi:hypothetical protein